jgi:branched-chain amino acid transport system substrate-binding protein
MSLARHLARGEKLFPIAWPAVSAIVMIVALVFALSGCTLPAAAPTIIPQPAVTTTAPAEKTAKVFKLGILGPFTGPAARTGDEFKGAATMAFDAINWQIGEYKIEPIWIDSQSDPDKAVAAYEQAVQAGIQAGILNWHSSVAAACMEVTAKHKIPHIFGFGATELVNEKFKSDPAKYGYWMNKGWPIPEKLSISYVQALEDAIAGGTWTPPPSGKTFAVYVEDTAWGLSFAEAIKGQLQKAGWSLVSEEHFDLNQADFYGALNELATLQPALIVGTSTAAPSMSAFIKQADEVGLESLMIFDGLGWFGEWHELVGESSDYILDQIPSWATEEGKKFAEQFTTRWGFPPSPSAAGLAYDGTNLFIQVARHALDEYGALSSEAIYKWARENLQTGKWSYTDGVVMNEYKYTPEIVPDPVVGKGYYIFPVLQYFDGVGKIIYPPDWAEQKLQAKP